ncbi:protein downstream neighbor of son homolog isoform X2 [Prorops nasuta]|uniref:protein downstream neighbor of son homolog isoform X2 n=1 Tax=Prorops nasuta TaxID=863751 RepID=UPI0034CD9B0A
MAESETDKTMQEPEKVNNALEWKRPDQVMELHRLKMKKRALQARISGTSYSNVNINQSLNARTNGNDQMSTIISQKRKNPFIKDSTSKRQNIFQQTDFEVSSDNTLFELLHIEVPKDKLQNESCINNSLTFTSALSKLETGNTILEHDIQKGETHIPLDWTLNTKMRFTSRKPFPWNGKLKTSEEASGTTGFVRCLDIGEQDSTLDTSPNARFHQCCLVWQHPSLSWLEMFPRSAGRVSSSLSSNSLIANNHFIKESLYKDWCESFRSLFHLLRARQCPYFYVCANTFTVLFRAAGICGLSEVHALVTPTTRGFRQALKQEEIEYTMPLRKDCKRLSDATDSGFETLDSSSLNITASLLQEDSAILDNDDDDETQDEWLQSLGVDDSEIKKINSLQTRKTLEKESQIDNLKQSLAFVKGVEAQALFNFLINCKSATATTGALAGVPPTLLAPTAFHGATLRPLKVKDSIVRVDNEKFYSLEIKGPVLPHVLPSLCYLMKSSHLQQYSVSCAHLASTLSFSLVKHGSEQFEASEDKVKVPQSVFGQENLSDCGFSEELLRHFCDPDPKKICTLESLKFSNNLYTWS